MRARQQLLLTLSLAVAYAALARDMSGTFAMPQYSPAVAALAMPKRAGLEHRVTPAAAELFVSNLSTRPAVVLLGDKK